MMARGKSIALLILLVGALSVKSKAMDSVRGSVPPEKKPHAKRQIPSLYQYQLQQNKLKAGYPFVRQYYPSSYQYTAAAGLRNVGSRTQPVKPPQSSFANIQNQRYPQGFKSLTGSKYVPYYYPQRTHYRDWSRKVVDTSAASRRLEILRKQKTLLQNQKLHQGGAGIKFFVAGIRPTGTVVGHWMNQANSRLPAVHQNIVNHSPQNIVKGSASYGKKSPLTAVTNSYGVFGENKHQAGQVSSPNIPLQQTFHQVVQGQNNNKPTIENLNSYRTAAGTNSIWPHPLPRTKEALQNTNQQVKTFLANNPSTVNVGSKDMLPGRTNPSVHSSLQANPSLHQEPTTLTTNENFSNGVIKSEKLGGATLGPNAHSLLLPTTPQQSTPNKIVLQSKDSTPKNRQGPSGATMQALPQAPLNSGVKPESSPLLERNIPGKQLPSRPDNLVTQAEHKDLGNLQSSSTTTAAHPKVVLGEKSVTHSIPLQHTTPRVQVLAQTLTTTPSQRPLQNRGPAKENLVSGLSLASPAKGGNKPMAGVGNVNLIDGNKDLSLTTKGTSQLPSARPEMGNVQLPKNLVSNYAKNLAAPKPIAAVGPTTALKTPIPGVMAKINAARHDINSGINNNVPGSKGINSMPPSRDLALKNILFPPPSIIRNQALQTSQRAPANAFQRDTMSRQGYKFPATAELGKRMPPSLGALSSKKQAPRLSFNNFRVNRLNLNFPLPGSRRNNVPGIALSTNNKPPVAQRNSVPFKTSFPLMLHKISPYFKMKRNLKNLASEQAKARRRFLELQPIK